MKIIKNILIYVTIFAVTVGILFGILILACSIPKECIDDNIKNSVNFFKENDGVEELQKRREYSYLHYYADSIILNIIYCIDSDNPIESALYANYYEKIYADINNDFIELVEEQKEANKEYIRYWHGSITILRPLLTIYNIEQIYKINILLLSILAIIVFILLFRRCKKLAIIYILAMVMIAFPVVPLCLEYVWTFYIMLIVSIIAILVEHKGDKALYKLFFITGIVTCFLDFLTTEIITLFVPLLFVLIIRKEENRLTNFKEGFILFIKISSLWGIAYICMWCAKWIIASIVLNINALDYVADKAMNRINGLQGLETSKEMYLGAITKNVRTLYPINIEKNTKDLMITVSAIILVLLFFIDWKNIKHKWLSLLLLIIALMPYARYLILANHSYRHAIFTFRSQIITIIAIVWVIIENLNYKLLLKDIRIRKVKNEKVQN